MQRIAVLVEEQNAKNNVVLDALLGVMEKKTRLEDDQKELRQIVLGPRA